MTANPEGLREDRPSGRNAAVLPALLALLAVCFSVNDLLAATARSGSLAWQPLGVLVINLLMVGVVWGLSRLKPSTMKAVALLLWLGILAFTGFSVAASILKILIATNALARPWAWQTTVMLVSNLLIGVGAIGSFLWLTPWKGWKGEPVSPATDRANKLFGLKELLAAVAMLALLFGAGGKDHPLAGFSNSPVPLWIAVVAITSWLLARVLREWWHYRADEHEQRAIHFGRRVGAGLFLAVTPAWWVAARAGLAPQPDAMILWIVTMRVTSFAWSWHRYH